MPARTLLPLLSPGPAGVPAPAPGCHCAQCPFYMDNPRAVEPVCSGTNPECEYCSCARAEAATEPGPRQLACGTCPIRCGSRIDIASWMVDVGRLGFEDVRIPGRFPDALPHYIPQVDGSDIPGLDADLGWGAYAVGLRRVISPATGRVFPKFDAVTAKAALGLAEHQRAVLVCYSEDPLIEKIWTNRHAEATFARVAAMGWDLVLAPNASLYANQPRAENLINMRRNMVMAAELAAAGVPAAAPCVYWLRLEDLDRYVDWVHAQPTLPAAIAVNLQTLRTDADWQLMVAPGLAYLAAHLPENLPVVLTGASRAARIAPLRALFGPRLYLVSQNAMQYARHGALMTDAGRVDRHARVEDLFAANVRHYAHLADPEGHH